MKINGGNKFHGSEMQGRIKFLYLQSPLKSATLKGWDWHKARSMTLKHFTGWTCSNEETFSNRGIG